MIEDWLILKGTRIVIPNSKCKEILQLIHEGHLGLGKCKLQCKDMVYWLGINEQLEKLVLNCELCLRYSKPKSKQAPYMSLRQEVSGTSLDKSCHQHLSLWEWVLLTLSWLHQQIPHSLQANIYNGTASCKPHKADILRIWLARNHNIWQWSLLFSWIIH